MATYFNIYLQVSILYKDKIYSCSFILVLD